MQSYFTFIDEYGNASLAKNQTQPYYAVTAVLATPKVKDALTKNLDDFKIKYFGKKSHILHRNKILYQISRRGINKMEFVNDLKRAIDVKFFLFQVILDKSKARSFGWNNQTNVYEKVYKVLFGNLVKFSVARRVNNTICVEASSISQDIHIYKNFFHYIANGIDRLKITNQIVKKHLTSLNFVTKINNDAGEQLADLLSKTARTKYEAKKSKGSRVFMNKLDEMLSAIQEKKLNFVSIDSRITDQRKLTIYPTIKPFRAVP